MNPLLLQLLEILLFVALLIAPLCGVIFLIIGFLRVRNNASITDATPKKSLAIIYWGLGLIAVALAAWVFLFYIAYLAAGAAV